VRLLELIPHSGEMTFIGKCAEELAADLPLEVELWAALPHLRGDSAGPRFGA